MGHRLVGVLQRVGHVLRPTPVDRSDSLSRLAGRPILLKPEHLQRTGSFKIRGAYNFVSRLPAGVEVVAASAGNHAQALAAAAAIRGVACEVFVPSDAPMAKVEAASRASKRFFIVSSVAPLKRASLQ